MKREQESIDFEGIENDEEHNGTIYNANNGTCNQIDYKNTIDDNSTRDTTKGVEAGGTTDDISIGKIVEGAEPGS